MPAARNEIFGPLAIIIKADGDEDAIRCVGRSGGEWATREFTTEHRITIRQTPRKYLF
jgi:hypothetical protein